MRVNIIIVYKININIKPITIWGFRRKLYLSTMYALLLHRYFINCTTLIDWSERMRFRVIVKVY